MYTIQVLHVESCMVKSGPQTCITSLLYKCRTTPKLIGFDQNLKNTKRLFRTKYLDPSPATFFKFNPLVNKSIDRS